MQTDLHIHSYFSDGEYSQKNIITEAIKKNVSIISITDHNFLPENETIKKYSEKNNIKFIEGIEISALWRHSNLTTSLHILGYGKKLNREFLNKNLTKTINKYNQRALSIINKLNKEFPLLKLNFESLKSNNKEVYISRNTLARLMVKYLKNSISIKEALKQYVFIEEDDSWMMTPEEIFKLITSANGIPVLAHSGRELKKIGLIKYNKMIAYFVKKGLLGLEVYYPKHTIEEINVIKNISNKFNLYITGGSDWHGKTYSPDIEIGKKIPIKEIAPFLSDKRIDLISFI